MIEVAICSERQLFQWGVAACLAEAPDLAVVARGAHAGDLGPLGRRSVVILDGQSNVDVWSMPGKSPVVLLADPQRGIDVPELLRAGVRGIFVGDFGDAALGDAVRVAARGDLYVAWAVADRMLAEQTAPVLDEDVLAAEEFHLTAREVEIWVLLAAGGSNEDIAERMDLSARTVRFHLSNLFRKLNVQKRGEAIALAYRTAGLPAGVPGVPARTIGADAPVGGQGLTG